MTTYMRNAPKAVISLGLIAIVGFQTTFSAPLFAASLSDADKAGIVETQPITVGIEGVYDASSAQTTSTPIDPAMTATVSVSQAPQVLQELNIASALPDPIASGINFLSQTQNTDGSWSQNGKASFVYTAAVLEFLQRVNGRVGTGIAQQQIDVMYPLAKSWVNFAFPENSEDLAAKITLLANAGEDMSTIVDFLSAQINVSDLGFGYKREYRSDLYATGEVLRAIAATNYEDPGTDPQFSLKAALLYVLNRQDQFSGGWEDMPGWGMSQFATNAMLRALLPYQGYVITGAPAGDIVLNQRIANALQAIKSGEWPDGSWWGEVPRTALLFDTLLSYNATTSLLEGRAATYLLDRQNADGSFMSPADIYTTAKSLQAIGYPDIKVVDIQNLYTSPGANAGLSVTIQNIGYTTSLPLNHSALPSALRLQIDGQEISLDTAGLPAHITLEQNATLILQIQFSAPVFGEHSVKFIADYQFPELQKGNDTLTKNIQFNSPQFSGPLPPSWIGASSDAVQGGIILRWRLSTDPSTDHLVIYASTASGIYNDAQPYFLPGGNVVGATFFPGSAYWNAPIYFTIASVNAQGQHGKYSPETWAIPYSDPQNHNGTLSGRVYDKDMGQGVANGTVNFWNISSFGADQNGNYSVNYYPGFYFGSGAGPTHYSLSGENVQVVAGGARAKDFPVINYAGATPAPIAGLTGTPGNHQITLNWDSYLPITPPDFKRFDIYRSTQSFGSITAGMVPIDTSLTNPAVTSFVDTTVTNGVGYFYAVVPENTAGRYPSVSSIGAFRANSAPRVTNVQATQNGSRIDLAYDFADDENLSIFARFQYWDQGAWQEANTTVGEGTQSLGTLKLGVWNVKQDLPNFEGQIKMNVVANDSQQVNNLGMGESAMFTLDTRDPVAPSVDDYASTTALTSYQFTGNKEANTSLVANGVEVVPLDAATTWVFVAPLQSGVNTLDFTAKDVAGNGSAATTILITLDTSAPPSGGGQDDGGGRDVEIRPAEGEN